MPEGVPVTDSSPLIYLARADRLWLLQLLSSTVLVPEAVAREIEAKNEADAAARALRSNDWLRIVGPIAVPKEIQRRDLGRGEVAVLSWAVAHLGTTAVIDDREARRCAQALNVPVVGTLGLVLRAKSSGVISSARRELERLIEHGMYLSHATRDQALALVGE